ncbi:hypothetical protein Hesp01_13630 [Herbidospora sp. NBRC 101105]|nr:hypothetical protein Hesp01_13630 [Herbidospora sp. NBRC 101105]
MEPAYGTLSPRSEDAHAERVYGSKTLLDLWRATAAKPETSILLRSGTGRVNAANHPVTLRDPSKPEPHHRSA